VVAMRRRGVLVLIAVVVGLLVAPGARGTTFQVTTNLDSVAVPPPGSLRAAIIAANLAAGPHRIEFAIPNPGPHVITLAAALPALIQTTTIDGYTQDGASANSLEEGTNANIQIEINGQNIGSNPVLIVTSPAGSVIRGVAINNSPTGPGIRFQGTAGNHRVEGCFVGTDAAGTADRGNGGTGISIGNGSGSVGTIIGGDTRDDRNVIVANGDHGVGIGTTGDITVMNNMIGITKANSLLLNGGDGVSVFSGTGHLVADNSIASDTEGPDLAIDLEGNGQSLDGVTPNDGKDADTGPNNLQNFPKLTSVSQDEEGFTIVKGQLKSTPRRVFNLQFFANPPNAQSDAVDHLGDLAVKTNRDGLARFRFVSIEPVAGSTITATATRASTNDTSEVSAPVAVPL
jgi:hypothetical protein